MQMSYNKNLCTFEEQQESQDDWSMASKMESGSRDEIRKKAIGLVGPWRTWVKNSDFVLNITVSTMEGRERTELKKSLVHIFQEEHVCYLGKSRN